MDNKFWKDKHVLITGWQGFVGSHLTKALLELKANICGLNMKILGKKENYKILNQAKFEIKHQYLASGKARGVLNWKPQVTLAEGLRRTIGWYRQLFAEGAIK